MAQGSTHAGTMIRRYRDAYRVANTIITIGGAIKVIGFVLAILIAVVSLVGGAAIRQQSGGAAFISILTGAIFGGIVGLLFWLMGVVVSAQGQLLFACLDTAVNGSPFISDDEKAEVMTFAATSSASAPKGDLSMEFVSLAGQSGEAFCLGCRLVASKNDLWYQEASDTYYHKKCMPT